ncbi:MAG: HEAT repeat domain-containing protein [Candidatus Neomarinimicrobiota bacterium]|nr:HEAT repeat domain-containing protein [Candidatus Neomarinimicrobiota bacterium]
MAVEANEKSSVRVIIHSFFVVPFLIAALGVLLFFIWSLLTYEPKVAEEFLADVKIGGATKRWQSAYELSKLLADPDSGPVSERFVAEMASAYEYALNDPNPRVRQYLLRAMGQTGHPSFVEVISNALKETDENVVADAVYALSFYDDAGNSRLIDEKVSHASPLVRNRTAIALGAMRSAQGENNLRSLLSDPEPNVRWNAAVSLAKHGDASGRNELLNLLDRSYLSRFEDVDRYEKEQAMMVAVKAAALLNDDEVNEALRRLSEKDENLKLRDMARKALNPQERFDAS